MFLQSIKRSFSRSGRKASLLISLLLIGGGAFADGPPPPSSLSNPFVVAILIIVLFLALVIALLANLLVGYAKVRSEKEKEKEKESEGQEGRKKTAPGLTTTAAMTIGLLLLSAPLWAQDKTLTGGTLAASFQGVSPTAFYFMCSVVLLELAVVMLLLYHLRALLRADRPAAARVALPVKIRKPALSWWARMNSFRPADQEQNMDLGHDYDGIRELDNRLPPWWLYGFYLTILFAGIYLWRYQVSHSGPSGVEEYRMAVAAAEKDREAYLKKAANNVDENTVKLLDNAADLGAGKAIFETTCFACHGKQGEGGVGPNLTDDYWLHGGSIHDVFRTIKYGVPEKGMKSWKDDFGPKQIAQLASYIKSLYGTNPPNGKAPQGNKYDEKETAGSDPTTSAPGK
jgi:cytochrome c oxidase cbb3-type subunit 3